MMPILNTILVEHLSNKWRNIELLAVEDGVEALCIGQFFVAYINGQELEFGQGGTADKWDNLKINAGDPNFFHKLDEVVEDMLGRTDHKVKNA